MNVQAESASCTVYKIVRPRFLLRLSCSLLAFAKLFPGHRGKSVVNTFHSRLSCLVMNSKFQFCFRKREQSPCGHPEYQNSQP